MDPHNKTLLVGNKVKFESHQRISLAVGTLRLINQAYLVRGLRPLTRRPSILLMYEHPETPNKPINRQLSIRIDLNLRRAYPLHKTRSGPFPIAFS